ncbi:MAG: class I SAM-dependent methyltransferase [bacterium]
MSELTAAEQSAALFAREEAGKEPPHGLVLDLGCGSGIWAVELAKRGWQVTGVDFVPKGIAQGARAGKGSGCETASAARLQRAPSSPQSSKRSGEVQVTAPLGRRAMPGPRARTEAADVRIQ